MKKFCIEEILDAAIRFRGTMDEVPLEGFRYEVQSIIRNLGTAIGAPTNYIMVEMMTAFGTALGKKFIIEDWTYKNYLNTYTCLYGYPGDKKSPSVDYVFTPMTIYDRKNNKIFRDELRKAKSSGADELPVFDQRIYANNTTIEKLFRILRDINDNCKGTGLVLNCGELLKFFGSNSQRYGRGNVVPYILDLYSGRDLIVDRMYDDEGIYVESPFLSIIGEVQPNRIAEVFAGEEGSGFFDRWLFAIPNEASKRCQPNAFYMDYWTRAIERAIDVNGMVLHFTPDAMEVLLSYDEEFEDICRYLRDTNIEMGGYVIKQSYTIRRLAGIIHCLNSLVVGEEISPLVTLEELDFSYCLVWFFIKSAAIILHEMKKGKVDKLGKQDVLRRLNELYPIQNIQMFSDSLGGKPSRQFISRVLLHGDTTKVEKAELLIEEYSERTNIFIMKCCSTLAAFGLPSKDEIADMMDNTPLEINYMILQRLDSFVEQHKNEDSFQVELIYSFYYQSVRIQEMSRKQ